MAGAHVPEVQGLSIPAGVPPLCSHGAACCNGVAEGGHVLFAPIHGLPQGWVRQFTCFCRRGASEQPGLQVLKSSGLRLAGRLVACSSNSKKRCGRMHVRHVRMSICKNWKTSALPVTAAGHCPCTAWGNTASLGPRWDGRLLHGAVSGPRLTWEAVGPAGRQQKACLPAAALQ